MAFDVHSLEGYSTVLTAPSPATSGTSLVVQSGDGAKFGNPQNCTVWPAGAQPTKANSEIVRITGISTDTFTITRTQEGSSARAIVVGDQVCNSITPKVLTDIENQTFNAYKFSVYRNGALTPGADTNIIFDTADFDTGSNVALSTGKFTAPVAGFYQVQAGVAVQGTPSSYFMIALVKNTTVWKYGNALDGLSNPQSNVSDIIQLAANDTLSIQAHMGSSVALTVSRAQTYFSGFLVSLT